MSYFSRKPKFVRGTTPDEVGKFTVAGFVAPTLVEQLRIMRTTGVAPDIDVSKSADYDGTPVGNFDVNPEFDIRTSRMDRVAATMTSWSRLENSQPVKAAPSAPDSNPDGEATQAPASPGD